MPPLHLAASMDAKDIVCLLLKYGANVALTDKVLSEQNRWLAISVEKLFSFSCSMGQQLTR